MSLTIDRLMENNMPEPRTYPEFESRAHLQAVATAVTETSIITTDLNGLVTLVNAGAERILGYRANNLIGKQPLGSLHVESHVGPLARNEEGSGRRLHDPSDQADQKKGSARSHNPVCPFLSELGHAAGGRCDEHPTI